MYTVWANKHLQKAVNLKIDFLGRWSTGFRNLGNLFVTLAIVLKSWTQNLIGTLSLYIQKKIGCITALVISCFKERAYGACFWTRKVLEISQTTKEEKSSINFRCCPVFDLSSSKQRLANACAESVILTFTKHLTWLWQ